MLSGAAGRSEAWKHSWHPADLYWTSPRGDTTYTCTRQSLSALAEVLKRWHAATWTWCPWRGSSLTPLKSGNSILLWRCCRFMNLVCQVYWQCRGEFVFLSFIGKCEQLDCYVSISLGIFHVTYRKSKIFACLILQKKYAIELSILNCCGGGVQTLHDNLAQRLRPARGNVSICLWVINHVKGDYIQFH